MFRRSPSKAIIAVCAFLVVAASIGGGYVLFENYLRPSTPTSSSCTAAAASSQPILSTPTGSPLFVRKGCSVDCNNDGSLLTLPQSDADTFQAVEYLNSTGDADGTSLLLEKDKHHVYLGCSILSGADPGSFVPIDYADGTFSGYVADKTGAYFADDDGLYGPGTAALLPFSSDTLDFEVLNGWEKSGIANYSWSPGDPIPDDGFAEPHYARSTQYVYVGGAVLAGADPSTFVVVPGGEFGESFGKDNRSVFIGAYAIPGINPATFAPVGSSYYEGGGYVKDAQSVFYVYLDDNDSWSSDRIAGADPPTFSVTNLQSTSGYDAKDKNHKYLDGEVVQ